METSPKLSPAPSSPGQGCAAWFVRGGRLRSGWRVLFYAASARLAQIALAFAIAIAFGIYFAAQLMNQGIDPADLGTRIAGQIQTVLSTPLFSLGYRLIDLLTILAIVWLFRRFIDQRSFRSLGFQTTPGWMREFCAGFGASLLMWCVIFVIALATGAASVRGLAWDDQSVWAVGGALVAGLLMHLMVGIAEETDSRGYVLQNLEEGLGIVPAVLLSAIYFGALHWLNPGAGIGSTLGIFAAGVLLAMGYVATRRLWFAIGLHAAWNWAEGPLLGFSVSGLDPNGLLRLNIHAPEWWLGGAFGPEAGALAIGVEIIAIILLIVWARRRRAASP